jgi:hypothetical protein
MRRLTAVLLAALILAISCSGSSPSPEVETFFSEIEAGFEIYDARKQDISDEFNSQLPQADSAEKVDAITREQLRALLVPFGEFQFRLDMVEAVEGLTNEHGVLLHLARGLGNAYAEEVARLDAGGVRGAGASATGDVVQAVSALGGQCRTLQRIADDRGVDVHLVCSPNDRQR